MINMLFIKMKKMELLRVINQKNNTNGVVNSPELWSAETQNLYNVH